jgi:hypothetical protein
VILRGVLTKGKALLLSQQGFSFVDKRFEISNLELIRDIVEIMKMEKAFSTIK